MRQTLRCNELISEASSVPDRVIVTLSAPVTFFEVSPLPDTITVSVMAPADTPSWSRRRYRGHCRPRSHQDSPRPGVVAETRGRITSGTVALANCAVEVEGTQ